MNEPKQPRRLNTSAANHSGSAPRPAAPAGQRKINRSGAAPQRPAQSAAPGQRTAPRGASVSYTHLTLPTNREV